MVMQVTPIHDSLEPDGRADDAERRTVERAYAQHAPALVGFGRRLGLDEDEASEVVQEAHVRLWLQLRAGHEIRDARAWLAGATYRLAMDRHRTVRRIRALRDRLAPPPSMDADAGVDRLTAWALVDRLPERQRAALHLHYRLDLPFEEVGEAMGITTGAARTLASRGLSSLRTTMATQKEP
jgi:RNA polymerase sigma-70 factor (ECF subfamily)